MDRTTFAARLVSSAEAARRFAGTLVTEALPAALAFRVRLNQSNDAHVSPQPGEVRFPHDSNPDRDRTLLWCDESAVVDELWRDGRVPEWVNLSVIDRTSTVTLVEVVCCGRFTDDESRLYHVQEGAPPFHVLGPTLPAGHDGSRFSIHHRSECWGRSDVDRLADVADKVWSLELHTDEFDAQGLSALPALPGLELLEHTACALGENAFSAFHRFSRLRVLRLHLTTASAFSVGTDDACGSLTSLTINNLPPHPWGFAYLAHTAPAVTDLTLRAADVLWLDGEFPEGVRTVWLSGSRVAGATRLPARLDGLTLSMPGADDGDVLALLAGVVDLQSLTLSGTPITDELALALARRFDLRHLNLTDTAVTEPALRDLSGQNPGLRLFPRPKQ
ncbi:hypothetical protein GCM10027280_51280 [Micromonospora polyrhachis]|uniref:Uncharacterized protein n=1 Tax=Micromonospora polyrhachis TaxID=1282883 RepID=A0A7W7SX67_9ACTN|nr:hypothetical protein [Micromonospora polyrhachis]MBB4961962.1 hypothetical protein [Micromonospora polyrhachis]